MWLEYPALQVGATPFGWFETSETRVLGPKLGLDALDKVEIIREMLFKAQNRQKAYADDR